MKTTIIGLFFLIMSSQWSFAQNSVAEQEIINLSKVKWQWMSDKKADTLSNLAAYTFWHSPGIILVYIRKQ
jgi:hypothetical protein